MYSFKSEAISEAVENIKPQGWKVLVAMPEVIEKTKGGVFMPDDLKTREGTASIVGKVVAMGPMCYNKWEAPWCKTDDVVVFRSYSGVRLSVQGQEFRLVNDDTIEAVVNDPAAIERV